VAEHRDYFIDMGRKVISSLLLQSERVGVTLLILVCRFKEIYQT